MFLRVGESSVGDENSKNAYLIYADQDMKYLPGKDTGLSPDKIKK